MGHSSVARCRHLQLTMAWRRASTAGTPSNWRIAFPWLAVTRIVGPTGRQADATLVRSSTGPCIGDYSSFFAKLILHKFCELLSTHAHLCHDACNSWRLCALAYLSSSPSQGKSPDMDKLTLLPAHCYQHDAFTSALTCMRQPTAPSRWHSEFRNTAP